MTTIKRRQSMIIEPNLVPQEIATQELYLNRKKAFWVLFAVSSFPLVILTILTLEQTIEASVVRHDAAEARDDTVIFWQFDALLHSIQYEKGISMSFIRDNASAGAAGPYDLHRTWNETDDLLTNLDWNHLESLDIKVFPSSINTRDKFQKFLDDYRGKVFEQTEDEIIIFYTTLRMDLIPLQHKLVRLPEVKDIWRGFSAAVFLLEATEALHTLAGLKRRFAWYCNYTEDEYRWRLRLEGASEILVERALLVHPPFKQNYTKFYYDTELRLNVEKDRAEMMLPNSTEICWNIPESERRDFYFRWFQHAFQYQQLLLSMRNDLVENLETELDEIVYDKENEMMKYIMILLCVLLISFVIILWQVHAIYNLVDDVCIFINNINRYNNAVIKQQKRSDHLMYRIMPRSVAETLKGGKESTANYFHNVTICFVDIVDFMSLISSLKPTEVLELLSQLYRMYDNVLRQHMVYKVDQTNDIYCVVSGVESSTSDQAPQIADFALELMQKIKDFKADGLPHTTIQVRIGIHTGPCAAAVVGHSSIRYGVFGESVKMASRMSRTSPVQKIQISQTTRDDLLKYGDPYVITYHGEIDMFGFGSVVTYILQGVEEK